MFAETGKFSHRGGTRSIPQDILVSILSWSWVGYDGRTNIRFSKLLLGNWGPRVVGIVETVSGSGFSEKLPGMLAGWLLLGRLLWMPVEERRGCRCSWWCWCAKYLVA